MAGNSILQGFIGLEIEIIHVVPASWTKKKRELALTGRVFPTICDIDNQVKALCDGMNRTVYEDDRLINALVVRREFGELNSESVAVRCLETIS